MNTALHPSESVQFLKLLGHDVRWQLLAALAHSDYRVQELVERVGQSMNLVSYHLKQLRRQKLVTERRSSADGRDVYYSLDMQQLAQLFQTSGAALHPALGGTALLPAWTEPFDPPRPVCVLFLCTHNSARSQMAEGLLRHMCSDAVQVCSAGSEPCCVHPLAIDTLAAQGIDISAQRSKHMHEVCGQSFDYIITVCDSVRENCPVFPGDPECIHWSFPDPLAETGSEAARCALFTTTAEQLRVRLGYLLMHMERAIQQTTQCTTEATEAL